MSSVFKIYSPEDCDFYYEGDLQGHIEGNNDRAFRFEVERKGAYRLKFVNSEYKSELIVKVSIDADEEREVKLDFSEVNEPVIRRIIIAVEHDYEKGEQLPEEIISVISKRGFITIPKGVKKIGKRAFEGCSSLTSVTIPDSVIEIGHSAFSGCSSLTSITIPNSVTKIGEGAFEDCSSLTSVNIPDSITEIGDWAFADCSSLTSITIPDSVTKIGADAFTGCSSLKSFYGKYASSDNRCLITDDKLLAFAPYDITEYTIPNGVASIGDWAFAHCSSIRSITIPDSVTKIGEGAFSLCSSQTFIYCKATTPPKLEGGGIIYTNASVLKIYIPKSEGSTVLEAYKSAEGWKDYADIIEEYDCGNE